MDIRNVRLEPEMHYHIYNRGVNGMPIFLEEKNYEYFINQYYKYVHPYVQTYAYCLIENHFHLLIKVKPEFELEKVIINNTDMPLYWHVSNGFSSFLKSYTRGMNKMYHRTGPIFESPFKRIAINEESYFSRLVAYIHLNPVKHGITTDYKKYPYSSYQIHASSAESELRTQEIINWFGNEERYLAFHEDTNLDLLNRRCLLE